LARTADDIAASGDSLRQLSARLETAREEERTRVARELHDELGQVLTSLKLEFMWLIDRIRQRDPRPDVQFVNKLQSLTGLVELSIATVRRISGDLRPAVLDHLGLPAAIEWEATKFEARTGIRCRFASQLTRRELDRDRAIAVYRILQEALTNVARHAHAGAVHVDLRGRGRFLNLIVKDNGRGITRAESSSPQSVGLLGMRERARLLGGNVTITGTPGRGTTVTLQVLFDGARPRARKPGPQRPSPGRRPGARQVNA
jgi:two-component system, NarL family, sensor histidine kinase UhpB